MRDFVLYIAQTYLKGVREAGSTELAAKCPFHKEGNERRPSLSISTETGQWYCHAEAEGGPLEVLLGRIGADPNLIETAKTMDIQLAPPKEEIEELPIGLLGLFDFRPSSLVNAGFREDVLREHRIGFDRRPQFRRVTYPIFCRDGVLRGIAGRMPPGVDPKYKPYKERDLQDLVELRNYAYHKSHWLWREDKVVPGEPLVLAEGYKATLWLAQHMYNSLALMGLDVSEIQRHTIYSLEAPSTYLFLDNNIWGIRATLKLIPKLMGCGLGNLFVCRYPDAREQPDDLGESELLWAMTNAHTPQEFQAIYNRYTEEDNERKSETFCRGLG